MVQQFGLLAYPACSIGEPPVTVVVRTLPSLIVNAIPDMLPSVAEPPVAVIVYVVAVSPQGGTMVKYFRGGTSTLEPAVHGAGTRGPGEMYERLSWKYCS